VRSPWTFLPWVAAPLALLVLAAQAPSSPDELRVITRSFGHTGPSYRPNEVIVDFADGVELSSAMRTLSHTGGLAARLSRFSHHMLVTLDNSLSVPDAVERLRHTEGVRSAEPNGIMHAFAARAQAATLFTPNDKFFTNQWNMKLLAAPRVWGIQKGDRQVVVAVVDTGIAFEDFGPFRKAPDWGDTVFVTGFNALDGTSHANDDNFHGTHVASTIAEATNNGLGVAGLAFGCALMPVKVLNADGEGSFFDIAEGIRFAAHASPRANVINMSLGGEGDSSEIRSAVDDAVNRGVVIVAAAGNDGRGVVSFPAAYKNVIAVGATDATKATTSYTNFGPEISVVAPGGDLDRDDDGDGFPDGVAQQTFDPDTAATQHRYDDFGIFLVEGTSMASPHVAAEAALLISQGIKAEDAAGVAVVRAAIESSAEDRGKKGRDDNYGHGFIRPAYALSGLGINQ
jgi:serine protease